MTESGVRCVAFTTKGLEDIAIEELLAVVPNAAPVSDRPKVVRFQTTGSLDVLARLRCFDDVIVEVGVATPGQELDDNDLAAGIAEARAVIEGLRPIGEELSITVSAIRRDRAAVRTREQRIVDIASAATGLVHRAEGRSAFDVRVQVDGDTELVGVRLFDRPLADLRPSRRVHRLGGLRPTIAAAMVRLATSRGHATVWDPFCGSGTILIEALDLGHAVRGSDIDPEAVEATKRNIRACGHAAEGFVTVADVLTPAAWERPRPDLCLVSNMPWNKQIPVERRTPLHRAVGAALASLATAGCPVVLLTTDPKPILSAARRSGLGTDAVQRRLGFAGQTPTLVSITPG